MNAYKKVKKKYKINYLEGVRKKRKIKVLYKQIGRSKISTKESRPKIKI